MNARYRFYIGSNNDTHRPDIKLAIEVLDKEGLKGYTVSVGNIGIWQGQREGSFIIEAIDTLDNPINDNRAKQLKARLESELKQLMVLTIKDTVEVM